MRVDYAVIEVGLGGLKDASNVINRSDKVCLITDIGFDHTEILGKSLTAIARQKAGIIHPGNVVFSFNQDFKVVKVIRDKAEQTGAKLQLVREQPNNVDEMPDFQFHNWTLAEAAFRYLTGRDGLNNLNQAALVTSQHTVIPGRMDTKHYHQKVIIMDGAHNPQKMETFVKSFVKLYPGIKPAVLIAMKDGKAYQDSVLSLIPVASRVITTTFTASQDFPIVSVPAEDLAMAFRGKVPVVFVPDLTMALPELLRSSEKVLVITGSIYLLGQLKKMADFLN
jgi:dihydrofolate synthase/folylpolyglutamate synthase